MKLSTIVRATVIAASASLVLGACTAGPGTTQSGASSQGTSDVTIGLTYIPNVQFAPSMSLIFRGCITMHEDGARKTSIPSDR